MMGDDGQLTLEDAAVFNGPAYEPARDNARLTGQLRRVFDLMRDGQWRTLQEIADETGDPHASISAQLRHLRKPRFGSHTVERAHIGGGLYHYRLLVNAGATWKEEGDEPVLPG